MLLFSSDTAKPEAESKQKTYASHEDAKQAFKDLLREKVQLVQYYNFIYFSTKLLIVFMLK